MKLCVVIDILVINMKISPRDSVNWVGIVSGTVMACCLLGAKPLHEPILICWQLDPWEQTSVKCESKYDYCE